MKWKLSLLFPICLTFIWEIFCIFGWLTYGELCPCVISRRQGGLGQCIGNVPHFCSPLGSQFWSLLARQTFDLLGSSVLFAYFLVPVCLLVLVGVHVTVVQSHCDFWPALWSRQPTAKASNCQMPSRGLHDGKAHLQFYPLCLWSWKTMQVCSPAALFWVFSFGMKR